MSLRISNTNSIQQNLDSRKINKPKAGGSVAASTGISLEKARKSAEAASRNVDPLRFELTNLNEQSVSIQKKISSHQTTLSSLEKFYEEVEALKSASGNAGEVESSLNSLERIIQSSEFEGRSRLKGSSSATSTNSEVEPVIVADPPQIGSYKLSILGKVSADSLQFEIQVADEPNFKKSLITALSPATGIIEGVEVYFEEKAGRQEAELEIKGPENGEFPLPDFSRNLDRLKTLQNDPESLEREAALTLRKVGTTIDGLRRGLDGELSKFQNISNAQENIRAAVSEPRSVSNAFAALEDLNAEISKQSTNLSNLFNSSDTAKSLLE